MLLRFSTLFSTDGEAIPAGPPAVIATDRWFTFAEGGVASVVVTQLPLDGGSAITDIEESVNGGTWASLGATAPGVYASTAEPGDTIRLRAVNAEGVASPSASKAVNAGYFFSASVTSTDVLGEDGSIERTVTSPAHLAAFDAGEGAPGLYRLDPTSVAAPLILFPGVVTISSPATGGVISLTHAPWAAGIGAVSISYRVMAGATVKSSSLPYTTDEAEGTLLRVLALVTANGVTTTEEIGAFTLAADGAAPVLSGFSVDYSTNKIKLTSSIAATVTWRRYPSGHVFVNRADEVLAGTGAIEGGTFAVVAGPNTPSVSFTGGISGNQEIHCVARVGAGPVSNAVGGPIHITPSGATLTAPKFRGSSVGGSISTVASVTVPLPDLEMQVGDLVILPIGVDCAANLVAGLSVAAPNGEPVLAKQALTDNGVAGDDGQSVALFYYRSAVARTGGNVTITIAAGGTKAVEQIICAPHVRFDAKASGDPFAQVVKTQSAVAQLSAASAALTAISAQSRIEAFLVSEFELPVGAAPMEWTLRQQARFGPQSCQLVSRNTATTSAEAIAAISLPLPVARRWVGLTWELLPLGA
jgi:hypothetical protein